jgi:hypothetical protein
MNSAVTVRYFFFTTALPIFRDTNLPTKIRSHPAVPAGGGAGLFQALAAGPND